ncbi:MAG: DUF5320 family protein [Methanomicrobiales archaeon]|nr:DUF5320 family protein [Methanomicrobiales archaeon]
MPGFDGTGPGGQGPMTGGGFGYCHPAAQRRWPPMRGYHAPYSPYPGPAYRRPGPGPVYGYGYGPGWGGMPRGGGRGRGGFGRGRGRGWWCW